MAIDINNSIDTINSTQGLLTLGTAANTSGTFAIQGIDIGSGLQNNWNTTNAAFLEANSFQSVINTSYATANVSFSAYANANAALAEANSFQSVINTSFATANVSFSAYANANAAFAEANSFQSVINTSFATANVSFSAYANANAAFAEANSFQSIINSAYSQANTADVLAQAAFNAVNTGLVFASTTAAGTQQSNATNLTSGVNLITSAATGTGVIAGGTIATIQYITNTDSNGNTLFIYPPVNGKIGTMPANTPITIANNYTIGFYIKTATQMYMVTGGPSTFGI